MYPAQTSLIPIHIALARFLETQGIQAIVQNYPFWYLGTTPFRFLTGPILPLSLIIFHKILPTFNLFNIFFILVALFWIIGGYGVYLLVRNLKSHFGKHPSTSGVSGEQRTAFLAAFFYTFGPIMPFIFRFSDGLFLIAFSFVPYVLILYLKILKNWQTSPWRSPAQTAGLLSEMLSFSRHPRGVGSATPDVASQHPRGVLLAFVILLTFVILLDSLIIPTLIFGMVAIFLANTGWKKAEENLKRSILIFAFSILISSLWYGPAFWLVLLGAPSLGGKSLIWIVNWLGKLLPVVFAFAMGIFSVNFFKKRDLLRDFCFYWLIIFGSLSMLRFLSDPDFWMDWIAYGLELQMGLGIMSGLVFSRWLNTRIEANKRIMIGLMIVVLSITSWVWIFNRYVIKTLQKDITKTVEYHIGKQLSEITKSDETVFLSGSTVFWLNAFFNIAQVRGGVDQVAVHPHWDKAAWEVREGQDTRKSLKWFKELRVSYLVVHSLASTEHYHDFKYPEKFERVEELKKIYDEQGDRIYKILY